MAAERFVSVGESELTIWMSYGVISYC